ncbi:heterogeneous nuclear ribonucleoprotein A/B-like [Sitodiplosis mosellana]|uniref:heterogeneous nuclear ribonucleoprotein A/B-like n=1 Tax=Sitodiplosis mosellana TaxID=263140 RepID=UPI0024441F73|nr:heterogeneous nuclear ribonucleoprotein A/B-like [Sitodiplosis mosellana]
MNAGFKMMLRRLNQIRMFNTVTEKDGDSLTLFVANLPWTVSKRELQNYFTQFGPVSSADVVFNEKTGLSRGFGYVTYSFTKSYVKALQVKNHMLEGKLLEVDQAKYSKKQSNYYNDV